MTTSVLYAAAGNPTMPGADTGTCRTCGQQGIGQMFDSWVKDTFNDWPYLTTGEIICRACLFTMDDSRLDLAQRVGKDKPQRMRNYSHFVVDGVWYPFSKGDKGKMRELLLSSPSVAIIAVGGQKHIIFKAKPGMWQIEEQSVLPFPDKLTAMLTPVEHLYNGGFSKTEIETGRYIQKRMMDFGLSEWLALESQIKQYRGSIALELALFLAQKEEGDGTEVRIGTAAIDSDLAGTRQRIQEQVRPHHLATVRGQHPQRGLHKQPEQVLQLTLF